MDSPDHSDGNPLFLDPIDPAVMTLADVMPSPQHEDPSTAPLYDMALDQSPISHEAYPMSLLQDPPPPVPGAQAQVPGDMPMWSAVALLNPRGSANGTATPTDSPQLLPTTTTGLADQLTFEFAGPDDTPGFNTPGASDPGFGPPDLCATGAIFGALDPLGYDAPDLSVVSGDTPSTGASGGDGGYTNGTTPHPAEANGVGGMGAMLERNFNLQDRTSMPEPKRRKIGTDDNAMPTQAFGGGGASGGGSSENGGELVAIHNNGDQSEERPPAPPQVIETVDLTKGGDEEVTVISPPKYEEVCYGMLEDVSVNCHKVPSPKTRVQALAGPTFWPLVKIVLRRRVGDPTNTIEVYDHTRVIFGRLDPITAGALAPLLDVPNLHLRTDARIPTRRKLPGEVAGEDISQSYKIELVLYGPYRFAKAVGQRLRKKNMVLIQPLRVDAGIRVMNPMHNIQRPPYGASNSSADASTGSRNGSHTWTPALHSVARTVEEMRTEVMGVFDSMTESEDLPEVEPDDRIQTELLRHQKQALYFMIQREKPLAERADSKLTASIWQKKLVRGEEEIYQNVITGQQERDPPPDTLGGILADTMGLGKTLSVLSLVACTSSLAEDWAQPASSQPLHPTPEKPSASSTVVPKAEPLALPTVARNGKGTLLICPLSTVTNWEEQIKQHTKPGAFKFYIYHGQNRIKDVDELMKYDLVITTYGSVSSELNARNRHKNGPHPLEEIAWFRVVLDEAHMIREHATLQFKAIYRLQAQCRWAVTGTPVQNRLDDLGSLLMFLRLKPFDERNNFIRYIVTPFRMADPEILPKLRVLVDTVTLRRLKDKINLPPRYDEIVQLDFSAEEQRLYDMFELNAKERVKVLTDQRERLLGGKTYIHILQSILRLRLICAHGKDLLNEEDLEIIHGTSAESAITVDSDDDEDRSSSLTESKAYKMFDLMVDTGNDVCINCKQKLGSNNLADIASERQEDVLGYMTPCFHLYCAACIPLFKDIDRGLSYRSNEHGICPACGQPVKFSCVELRHAKADAEHEGHANARVRAAKGGKAISLDGYTGPHTKTRALVQDLLENRAESERQQDEPPIKSVVFSGWTSHLDLIQIALENAGITYCRLDGKMSRTQRTQAMDTFREDDAVHVILVSIHAGGLGLNLTAGSKVYVMEPQYNPQAEAQAVDRVHRLGQKRPVHTVRYIMNNSWELHMLEVQQKKIQLANLSMDRTKVLDRTEAAKKRLMDLSSLFR